jgi:hypothetical protein
LGVVFLRHPLVLCGDLLKRTSNFARENIEMSDDGVGGMLGALRAAAEYAKPAGQILGAVSAGLAVAGQACALKESGNLSRNSGSVNSDSRTPVAVVARMYELLPDGSERVVEQMN